MKLQSKFAAFVKDAKLPGYRKAKPVILVSDTTVDIQVATADEMPVALRTHVLDNGKWTTNEFNYRDGSFYRSTKFTTEEFSRNLGRPFFDNGPLRKALVEQLELAHRHPSEVIPEKAVSQLLNARSTTEYNREFAEWAGQHASLNEGDRRAVEDACESFHRACDDFVIMDGQVLAKCPEPILNVNVALAPGRIMCVPDLIPITSGQLKEVSLLSPGWLSYSVNELGEVLALSERLYDPERPWPTSEVKIEVLIPEAFTPVLPFTRLMRQLDICRRESHVSQHMPKNIVSRLNAFLSDDARWTEAAAYDEIEFVLSAIPDEIRWSVTALEYELARLETNPIELSLKSGPRI